jgi:hypothetical protein
MICLLSGPASRLLDDGTAAGAVLFPEMKKIIHFAEEQLILRSG